MTASFSASPVLPMRFPNYKTLAERFRHAADRWDDVLRAVLAIVNPRMRKRLAAAQAA